ncbi:hypothetical protein VTN96DRAFT_324 [Rasamsonia emersonii]
MIARQNYDPTCCVTPEVDNHAMLLQSGVMAGLAISGKSRPGRNPLPNRIGPANNSHWFMGAEFQDGVGAPYEPTGSGVCQSASLRVCQALPPASHPPVPTLQPEYY